MLPVTDTRPSPLLALASVFSEREVGDVGALGESCPSSRSRPATLVDSISPPPAASSCCPRLRQLVSSCVSHVRTAVHTVVTAIQSVFRKGADCLKSLLSCRTKSSVTLPSPSAEARSAPAQAQGQGQGQGQGQVVPSAISSAPAQTQGQGQGQVAPGAISSAPAQTQGQGQVAPGAISSALAQTQGQGQVAPGAISSALAQTQNQEQDDALRVMWKSDLRHALEQEIRFSDLITDVQKNIAEEIPEESASPSAIRACLNDPTYISFFKNITSLNLSREADLKVVPLEMSLLSGLVELFLSDTSLKEAPNLSQHTELRVLSLSWTQISSPPDLSKNPKLEELRLSGTPLTEAPSTSENPCLTWLDLSWTRISQPLDLSKNLELVELDLRGTLLKEAPDISKNTKLRRLDLEEAPLMFINDEVVRRFGNEDYVARLDEQKSNPCRSPLALLYQSIIREESEIETEKKFQALPQEDQKLIEAQQDRVPQNQRTFAYAVQEAIFAKFDRLSEEDKENVYRRMYAWLGGYEEDWVLAKPLARSDAVLLAEVLFDKGL